MKCHSGTARDDETALCLPAWLHEVAIARASHQSVPPHENLDAGYGVYRQVAWGGFFASVLTVIIGCAVHLFQ